MSKEMSTVTNKEPLMHISKRDGMETVSYTHLDVYKRQLMRCNIYEIQR